MLGEESCLNTMTIFSREFFRGYLLFFLNFRNVFYLIKSVQSVVFPTCNQYGHIVGDFPGGPMAKTTRSQCRGPGFHACSEN